MSHKMLLELQLEGDGICPKSVFFISDFVSMTLSFFQPRQPPSCILWSGVFVFVF